MRLYLIQKGLSIPEIWQDFYNAVNRFEEVTDLTTGEIFEHFNSGGLDYLEDGIWEMRAINTED